MVAEPLRYGTLSVQTLPNDAGTVAIELGGELDMQTSPQLKDQLRALTDDQGVTTLVLDLQSLEFIDSTGLGVLVGARKAMVPREGDVILRAPGPNAKKVLALTGLDRVFTIEE